MFAQDTLVVAIKHQNLFSQFCQFSVKYLPSTQEILTVCPSPAQHHCTTQSSRVKEIEGEREGGNIKIVFVALL